MQNFVVVLSYGLDQLSVEGFSFFLKLRGDVTGEVFSANGVILPDNRLHGNQIHHTFELVFLADGNLYRNGLGI